eukprot:scaffold36402_cov45-Phaeocystis_antarctica.AAC.3
MLCRARPQRGWSFVLCAVCHLASCHSRVRSGHASARTAATVAGPSRPDTESHTPQRRNGCWPFAECMWVPVEAASAVPSRASGRPAQCQEGASL